MDSLLGLRERLGGDIYREKVCVRAPLCKSDRLGSHATPNFEYHAPGRIGGTGMQELYQCSGLILQTFIFTGMVAMNVYFAHSISVSLLETGVPVEPYHIQKGSISYLYSPYIIFAIRLHSLKSHRQATLRHILSHWTDACLFVRTKTLLSRGLSSFIRETSL
jgi:hypothetical protein